MTRKPAKMDQSKSVIRKLSVEAVARKAAAVKENNAHSRSHHANMSMLKEVELSANEREFIPEALKQDVRLDGRKIDQFRELDLSFGDEYGSATARLGHTVVLVRVSSEITKPKQGREFEGIYNISLELTNMASPAIENGRQTELESYTQRLLDRIARTSNYVETESLCLVAGSKVWTIRADIHVLSLDGGLMDCCSIALMAALRHFRLPEVTVRGGKVTVYDLGEKSPVPLNLTTQPLSCTFRVFDKGKLMLLDPTLKEEQAGEGLAVVAMDSGGVLCLFSKIGGVPVPALKLMDCQQVARARVKEHTDILTKKLAADEAKRTSQYAGVIATAANDR